MLKRVGGGAAELRSIRRLGGHPREGKSQEGNDLRLVLTDVAGAVGVPGGLRALKARKGLGTMLAACDGGAQLGRVMAD